MSAVVRVTALLALCAGLRAECVVQAGSVLRVALDARAAASLKPASTLSGCLGRPVYSGTCQALPEGVAVRAVVERVERPRMKPVIGWIRRAAGAAALPPRVTLRPVELQGSGHAALAVRAQFLRLETERHRAAARKEQAGSPRRRMLLLEVLEPLRIAEHTPAPEPASGGMIAAGTRVRVDLVTALHSAKAREGDLVRARLAEPVAVSGRVIVPQGAVLEGAITHSRRARWMYRPGRMRLSFRSLRLPSGQVLDAALSPSAGEFANATRLDAEGGLTGGPLNRKRALINAGVAYLTGKILDDLLEESAKAAIGAAVAGSAEAAARYAGLAAGAFVFLMHRGRDISLGPHCELELTFSRDLQVAAESTGRQQH